MHSIVGQPPEADPEHPSILPDERDVEPAMRRRRVPASTARKVILDCATALFSSQTYESVSIERIAIHASLHKMTVYRLFGSREGLAVACATSLCEEERDQWERAVSPHRGDPAAQLQALFASLSANILTSPSDSCRLQLLANRFPDPTHPVRAVIARQKRECRLWLTGLLAGTCPPGSAGSASHRADILMLLWDGIVFNLHGTAESQRMARMLPGLVDSLLAFDTTGVDVAQR
jgi:AcrR family transcriptional regulator